ncbi:MAG: pantetheine-phosphate adenylyltransferase [Thaumarchaeota archaeon]|nr:pantetheine-phosphate adenylyltransferase [Nitrososphaerota archaeon]MCL5317698.1 pantetheine-phosphate adenylyltransferase [Nitrososphaerota archaeon]
MKRRCRTSTLGGTFDRLHKGHRALISKAFESGECVLIGVTTDEFAARLGKNPDHNFQSRVESLMAYLNETFPGRDYQIVPLNDYFAPETYCGDVEAVVVSSETAHRADEFNEKRRSLGIKPLKVIIVEKVLAEDGKPISTTRVRLGEIDEEGRLLH